MWTAATQGWAVDYHRLENFVVSSMPASLKIKCARVHAHDTARGPNATSVTRARARAVHFRQVVLKRDA